MLNDLKVQFNLNKCFVNVCSGEVIANVSLKGNLYQMIFTKVHEADMTNLVQFSMEDGAFKL